MVNDEMEEDWILAIWHHHAANRPKWHADMVKEGIADRIWRRPRVKAGPHSMYRRTYFSEISTISHEQFDDDDVYDLWLRHIAVFGVAYRAGMPAVEAVRLADRDALDHLTELRAMQRARGRRWKELKAAWEARSRSEEEHGIDLKRLER